MRAGNFGQLHAKVRIKFLYLWKHALLALHGNSLKDGPAVALLSPQISLHSTCPHARSAGEVPNNNNRRLTVAEFMVYRGYAELCFGALDKVRGKLDTADVRGHFGLAVGDEVREGNERGEQPKGQEGEDVRAR